MAGADPALVQGAGHEDDACPDDVQLRVAGRGDVCAVVLLVPHPLRNTKARKTVGAPPCTRVMLLERQYLEMITKRFAIRAQMVASRPWMGPFGPRLVDTSLAG